MSNAIDVLKKYWGHEVFRGIQSSIIESVLNGNDVLALMPTGGGKSICFQVPALMMDGVCLVITPLIALMKDQVEQLSRRNITAAAIHTGMSREEVGEVMLQVEQGKIKFLYLSPERLESKRFREMIQWLKPALIAIDEAHCISQWGYDFRPSYLKIASIRDYFPKTSIIALTASATRNVQSDICLQLKFKKQHQVFKQSFHRPNIEYQVSFPASKHTTMIEWINRYPGKTAIVYARSRKQTVQVAQLLNQHGILADFYHAGLTTEERSLKQTNWIENKIQVIVCTNAFGMGIDKPDVRLVIHLSLPESLEYYYQEAGRAGRDGKPALAVLLTSDSDFKGLHQMHALRYPDAATIQRLYFQLMDYLQVPAGHGVGHNLPFDLSLFSERFGWDSAQAGYALKTLEQEGLFYRAEGHLRPSSLLFITNRHTIAELEKHEPKTGPLIKALLRSYEGIWDFPANIRETWLAKQTSTPIDVVRQQLKWLHQQGMVEYKAASDKPEIVLLMNRMYRDDFKINEQRIRLLKEQHLERIKEIIAYASTEEICRSVFIGKYFDDLSIESCEVCDICKSKKGKSTNLNDRIKLILKKSNKGEISLEEINEIFNDIPKQSWNGILKQLIDDGLIKLID
jgi:ATP-dependent DNA helicase RecQ